jgi:lipopolysaccharide transport system ATP-binding protein
MTAGGRAIRVEGLGKRYRIGASQAGYRTLRETLMSAPSRPINALRSAAGMRRQRREDAAIWALRDVSFEVAPGEVVGIIGRNGAGKSTLLKILSRITEPTAGFAEVRGRVGSLLEVGTGFHPELTGRENIYLNGAILGLKRAEIKARFDEIAAFAEVEKFLDTPVKHYSSGMYMRLAFSVAAHLEPEVLIVDEVLAVGDASFQKKCLNKMEDVGRHGRTVIFVSHNMAAITRLCRRTVLLDEGNVLEDGPAHVVASTYLMSGLGTTAERVWSDSREGPGNDVVRMLAVRVLSDGRVTDSVDIRHPVEIQVEFEVLQDGHVLVPNINLTNEDGICIFAAVDRDPAWLHAPRPCGRFLSIARIPGNFFSEGGVAVRTLISTFDPMVVHADVPDAVAFHVSDSLEGNSARGTYAGHMPGVVRPALDWTDVVVAREHMGAG